MADLTTLQSWLTAAEQAHHELRIGARAVKVNYDGQSVEYSQASADKLLRYIRDLKRQIAELTGTEPEVNTTKVDFCD